MTGKLILDFLKSNIVAIIIIALLSTLYTFKHIEASDLEAKITLKDENIKELNNELTVYKTTYQQQVDENAELHKSLGDVLKSQRELMESNEILKKELSGITIASNRKKDEISKLKGKLTDDILLSKPYMIQKRIRNASSKAYRELQKETIDE